MEELQRVRSWFRDGLLVSPLDRPSSVHLARAVAACADSPIRLEAYSREIVDLISPAEHLIFVVADGLGMNLMDELPEGAVLRMNCIKSIGAVFPPSTGTALTSIVSGAWPATHGVLFWWEYLRSPGSVSYRFPLGSD
jgi:hypothetical protein